MAYGTRIDNYDITTKLKNQEQILEISAENREKLEYFDFNYDIDYFKGKNKNKGKDQDQDQDQDKDKDKGEDKGEDIKYFERFDRIKEIKNFIDKLLEQKEITINLHDQFLMLIYKKKDINFILVLETNVDVILRKLHEILIFFDKYEPEIDLPLEKELKKNSDKNYKVNIYKEYLPEKENITFLTFFPSGYTITGSRDGKLKIYETFDNKQKYNEYKAHKSCIMYISIKDDNEFASCSDIEIKIFNIKKEENEFIIENKLFIENAHNDVINKILYSENNILFSCSMDNYIKIWNLNNKDENIKIINENDNIFCFDFLNKENILISSGVYGTNIYDITINNNPFSTISTIKLKFEKVICLSRFGITILDDGKIIVCGNYINIISINDEKVIFTKKLKFTIWDCYFVKGEKQLFFMGSSNIIVILNENDQLENEYEVLMKIDKFEKKNLFRVINIDNNSLFYFYLIK